MKLVGITSRPKYGLNGIAAADRTQISYYNEDILLTDLDSASESLNTPKQDGWIFWEVNKCR